MAARLFYRAILRNYTAFTDVFTGGRTLPGSSPAYRLGLSTAATSSPRRGPFHSLLTERFPQARAAGRVALTQAPTVYTAYPLPF